MRCARTRALATFSAGRICNPNRHGHVRYHTLHKLGVAARIAPVSRAIRKLIPMHGGGATMILPEGAESTLTENAASPFLAEPAHNHPACACPGCQQPIHQELIKSRARLPSTTKPPLRIGNWRAALEVGFVSPSLPTGPYCAAASLRRAHFPREARAPDTFSVYCSTENAVYTLTENDSQKSPSNRDSQN